MAQGVYEHTLAIMLHSKRSAGEITCPFVCLSVRLSVMRVS